MYLKYRMSWNSLSLPPKTEPIQIKLWEPTVLSFRGENKWVVSCVHSSLAADIAGSDGDKEIRHIPMRHRTLFFSPFHFFMRINFESSVKCYRQASYATKKSFVRGRDSWHSKLHCCFTSRNCHHHPNLQQPPLCKSAAINIMERLH